MISANHHCVIGPPGCGKTTSIERSVAKNVPTYGKDRIVVCSLTRSAAAVAAGRVGLDKQNIGTLHSFAFRALGSPAVAETKIKLWNDEHPSLQIGGVGDIDDQTLDTRTASSTGDSLLSDYGLYRSLCKPRSGWPTRLLSFAKLWEDFKAQVDCLDFTDLIEVAARDTLHCPGNPDVIYMDEAQDSSSLEAELIRSWSTDIRKLIIVGDPNQSLFEWRGASPERFFPDDLPADRMFRLRQSYRVPVAVLERSIAWLKRMPGYKSESYNPTPHKGLVEEHFGMFVPSCLDIIERCMEADKSCMVIASCGFMLNQLIVALREDGIPFHNPYRRTNGAWNPLHGSGVTGRERLLSWLAPREDLWAWDSRVWTGQDVKNWAGILKDVFLKGKKSLLAELGPDAKPETVIAFMREAFKPEALERIIEQDFAWFRSHPSKPGTVTTAFPLTIADRFNPTLLAEEPFLTVGTIHSVKGGESDCVIVSPELSHAGWREFMANHPSIFRLFYVAMTRSRSELHLIFDEAKRMAVDI